jgi:hypothetical protein
MTVCTYHNGNTHCSSLSYVPAVDIGQRRTHVGVGGSRKQGFAVARADVSYIQTIWFCLRGSTPHDQHDRVTVSFICLVEFSESLYLIQYSSVLLNYWCVGMRYAMRIRLYFKICKVNII